MPAASPEPTGPPAARLPARSQRQAMDWSLVLASQGIEHVLDHSEPAGWGLVVAAQDQAAALAAIQQYRRENRRWPWRRAIPHSNEMFDWGVTAWVLLTVVFFGLSQRHAAMENAGIMNATALASGEWWRLFTATLLHADLAHLATNSVFGFIFLGLAMGRHGTGVGLLGAFLAGAGGNLASAWLHGKPFQGLGASGVVMGALGLVAVQSFPLLRNHPRPMKLLLGGIAGGVMLFVLLGLSPGTDEVAHFGGFLAGVGLGFLLAVVSASAPRPGVNIAAGLGFAALVVWTWALALRHAG